MKKTIFSLMLLSIITSGLFAQIKHSSETKYPSYKGLIMAGYQGWFRLPSDGIMYPDETNIRLDMWPDTREYEKTYPTGLKLEDGSTARFFNSEDKSTVDLHFKWMQEYGLDGVFVQRFFRRTIPRGSRIETATVLKHTVEAASKYERAYAVMYDL